jgi:hypothetical protein
MAVPVASKCFIHRTPYFPDEILEPANQIDGGGILIVASYPKSMCKTVAPSGFQRCSTAQLQVCSGVQMPLSPLVSAEVPAVSVAVQDPLSGLAHHPFPFLAIHRTSVPNHRVNSRRF